MVKNQLENTEIEHVIIDNEDGSFTSMTKEHYDAMQEAQQNLGGIN